MPHTYEELKKMTVADLRDVAKDLDHEAVQGYTQMNKEHLLPAVCRALGIDAHEHHVAAGEQKQFARARMHDLKNLRAQAVEAHDHERLKAIRREYHHLNHSLRQAARRSGHA
jgi:hypothetical protein